MQGRTTARAEFLESPLLGGAGFRHGFFTRHGGVSAGAYATLNFSIAVGDDPARVRENLRRAARELGVDASRVYFLSQVHGSTAIVALGGEAHAELLEREGDAIVSRAPEVACAVRVADCVPVLLADRASGGVAAVHVGWRGAVRGVIARAVEALRHVADSEVNLIAAIGPHISLAAFEVSDDVARAIADSAPGFDVIERSRAKPHADLRTAVRAQLLAQGLAAAAIDDVPGCTWLEPERFFSFRRDGKASGRHLAAIVPNAA